MMYNGQELSLEEVTEMMFWNLSSRDSPGAAQLGQRIEVNFGSEQLDWTIMIKMIMGTLTVSSF